MKQILLITDGCSNVGASPVLAAAEAREEGITVNVVGVIDYGTIGELGSREIEDIAKAGGGISQIVGTRQLAHTMQMMTRKTVVQTIQQAVNRELTQILGEHEPKTVTDLELAKRAQVVEVMEDLAETTPLQVVLLIDVSASMKPKLSAVEEGIRDLMLSLQARMGQSHLSVFHFPGRHSGEETVMDIDWTADLSRVRSLFGRMQMKGATPTGPAIQRVIDFYRYGTLEGQQEIEGNYRIEREGMLGDNVV
ncbi:Ca-activated chloride channel family protein [Paenibacillus pabuli]|uniref:Ca-activated chloride channel family protein n=1 Tax=Paenibacillus pabuli TaxID=1472 RepID=A0ABX9BC18_9BACL|nr:VWA domain-containing protein [Paenibacillus pabuli]RAI85054.1 Ca-activated chloride channel family protein [Paenibacillus pabuli]